jgi:4-hydroxybenzoate polyprenyltransferase
MEQKFFNHIEQFVKNLESKQITVFQWIATSFVIVLVKYILDLFIGFSIFPTQHGMISIYSYEISQLLGILLIIYFFTREDILKISRIILFFFPLILTGVFFDLPFNKGKYCSLDVSWVIISHAFKILFNSGLSMYEVLKRIFSGQIPLFAGFFIEVLLILLLMIIYVFLKTRKFFKSILAGLVGFAFISLCLKIIVFFTFYSPLNTLFLLILCLELSLWFFFYNREKFLAIVRNFRVFRLFHFYLMFLLGLILSAKVYPIFTQYSLKYFFNQISKIIAGLGSVSFAWFTAICLNDVADLKIDRLSNPMRPLPQGKLTQEEIRKIGGVFFILCMLFSYTVPPFAYRYLILIFIGLSYIYSCFPFRLKRFLIISKLSIATASLAIVLAGFAIFNKEGNFIKFPKEILGLILICYTLALNFIDIKDVEGDKKAGIDTIPTIFGENRGKKIIGYLFIVAYSLAPVILNKLYLMPLSFVVGSINFFILTRPKVKEKYIFIIYYLSFIGLVLII